MSKKRPTESSWDSDEELLSDTSGIAAFPKNSSELDLLAADGDLEDEDALLSIDEVNAKSVSSQFTKDSNRNTGQQDVGVDEQAFVFEEVDTGDLEDELNVQGEEEANYQEQHYAEDINYDEGYGADAAAADVYHGEDGGEGIAYSEEAAYQNADSNLEYNQEIEIDRNYVVQEGDDETSVELAYEQPEEHEEQVHLEYGDTAAQDVVEGSETERQFESESDSDDESSRHNRGKFTTERTGSISLVASKERSSIPDTLEIDKEQAEQINKFMADKNQGGKKSSRGRGGVHSRLGPRPPGPGGQPRLAGPMPPGPNMNPNFPMAPPGPLSPRMLMGLLRGGAQMLRGLIPAQLLNARGPMAAQSIARALRQRAPFPDGVLGPRGPPPLGVVDPRGPFPRPPPGLINQMRGPVRPGPQPGPGIMGDGGPLPPRMPGGPFPGPMNPRPPLSVMPQGRMRMMGPRGPPGGPPLPEGPRRMLVPRPMGRGGPRFGSDTMLNPPQIPGLMNRPRGQGPNQPAIRPLIPNVAQIRPGVRNQAPPAPNSQGKAKGLSVHDRLGPRDTKNVPPLMGIDPSKPRGQKTPMNSEQGQPIPSLVKPVTAKNPPGQANRLIRPQGLRFGNPDQMKQILQKGPPPGFASPNAMSGQARHKIFINPRFQGPQNPGINKPTGITRTVRFGTPLQQRKAKALLDKAVQNKMNPNVGPRGPSVGARGPINLKRRSTGADDVPAKVIKTVGQVGAQPVFVNRDAGKFRHLMEEQKRKRDLIIKRKELARQKQAAEKRKMLVGLDGQSTPGQVKQRSVVSSLSAPIQRVGSSVASRLGPPTNRNVRPFQSAPLASPRNVAPGSRIRGPAQLNQSRFAGQLSQQNPRPVTPRVQVPTTPTTPVFRPPFTPTTRPPGTFPVPVSQFSIPPPSTAPRYQTPPPRMNTVPTVPPPVNVQSAPPRYQAPQQASPYQTPPPATPPIYPPPPTQVAPPYPQAPPATAPLPSSQYPPPSYAPPPQHPPPAPLPPAPVVYQPPQTTYQPPQTTYQPPPTTYQPPQSIHQPQPTHYQPPVVASVAQTPSYTQPAVQPAQTEYPSSYPPATPQYPTSQRQDSQQYYDYSTGTYYPTTTYAAATTTQNYQYTAVPTQPQTSSYYDYNASTSQQNPVQSYGTQPAQDQRTVQHQSSVGQPIQTIGRRVQPATGSQMRTIVHNVTTSSPGSSHSSQSGRVVVDTNVSVSPGPQRVAVYNVAKQATKETLLKVCRHFGKVTSIQFTREQDKAIIQFETGEQAAKCVSKCDQKCLLKTRLTVKLLPS